MINKLLNLFTKRQEVTVAVNFLICYEVNGEIVVEQSSKNTIPYLRKCKKAIDELILLEKMNHDS